jgi:hypothetical protein
MPVTIHVNGTSNSLCHKGSMGIAKSTIPDVCKTPSPAGPVPIPYPVIISMSSQLANGTTTVKADGGNMIAVKGSEFSMCNGDQPGTAGGVKSSTFMKEATWILYSFDVKMDGKNACRLSDKMQMNHGNSACLGGIVQSPVDGATVLRLDCKPHWTPCQKEQMRSKAAAINAAHGPNTGPNTGIRPPPITLLPYSVAARQALGNVRSAAAPAQANYRNSPAAQTAAGHYPSACAPGNENRPSDADHIVELQMAGPPGGPFLMLDATVNRSSGAQIMWQRRNNPNGVTVARVEVSDSCN